MESSLAKRFGRGASAGSGSRQFPAGCKGFGYEEVCRQRDRYARAHRNWLILRDARQRGGAALPCSANKTANKQRLYLAETAFSEHKHKPGFLSPKAVRPEPRHC